MQALRRICSTLILLVGALGFLTSMAASQEPVARFSVKTDSLSTEPRQLSATIAHYGAGHRFIPGGDFEPLVYRNWFLTGADAPPDQPGRILAPRRALSRYDTLRSGALAGAQVSIMRIENGRFAVVREGHVSDTGLQVGSWQSAHGKGQLVPKARTRLQWQPVPWQRLDVPIWFSVRAVNLRGNLSAFSDPVQVQLPESLPRERSPVPNVPKTSVRYSPEAEASAWVLQAPQDLTAEIDADGTVSLTWQRPDRALGLAGYVVYLSHEDPAAFQGNYIDTQSTGAPIKAGDLVVLRETFMAPDRRKILSHRVWNSGDGNAFLPKPMTFWPGEDTDRTWHLHPHPKGQDWGGRSFLRLNLTGKAQADLLVYNHSGTDQTFYPVLDPELTYTVSARLRADRPGRATFFLGGPFRDRKQQITLPFGTEWTEVSAQFRVPGPVLTTKATGAMQLRFEGAGQYDVDDLRVRASDTDFLEYSEAEYDRLAQADLAALRTHGLIKTGTHTYDLMDLLSDDGIRLNVRQSPGLPHILRMMQKADVAPWLQIEPHFTRDEWLGLVEYLAAPFDPAKDDPDLLPWAALRVQQGRTRPWIEAFDTLYFELGNETWNRLFAPWIFPQMRDAATGKTLAPGTVYGLYHAYVVDILRTSPWWSASGLDSKTQFVIGGWNGFEYGTQAARAAPDASDLLSIATYNGGWDQNEGPPDGSLQSYFNVLNQVSQVTVPVARKLSQDATALEADRTRPLAVGSYEGGPGYALNGLNRARVTPDQARAQEEVMKSQAGGVATLDSFLAERLAGFSMQNFFLFKEGAYWSSHARWYDGGTPYPAWTLLSLMNRYGQDEMLRVETRSVPTEPLTALARRIAVEAAPQVAVYATRDVARLSLFVISRRVPGFPNPDHSGCTPVQIDLPIQSASRATLYKTVGAYKDHGVDGLPLRLEQQDLPLARFADGVLNVDSTQGDTECGLPPASAFVYVFEDPVFTQ